jgi:hypothetical protein
MSSADPQDLHVFGPYRSGSISQRYGSGYFNTKFSKFWQKIKVLRLKTMCLRFSYKNKYETKKIAFLKVTEESSRIRS